MKKLNSLENRLIALVLTLVMVLGMLPTGVPALASSVITTTLAEQNYLVAQTVNFTVTTIGNDDAGDTVLGAFEIRRNGKLVDIADVAKLECRDTLTGNWYEFYGEFGSAATGFTLQNGATTYRFRIAFKDSGNYNVKVFLKDFENKTELCAVEKNVTVSKVNPAVITTTLGDEQYTVAQSAEFTVTTTGKEDTGTMVLGSFEIQKNGTPVSIGDVAKLEYLDASTGDWYEVNGDFGPAETGFRLQAEETTSKFRVTFMDDGEYTVKVFVKAFEDNYEICAVKKTVVVLSNDPAVITTTFGDKNYTVGQSAEFTVTTAGNENAGIMVLGSFEFRKDGNLVNIADVAKLEYLDASTGDWYAFYGDFGPAETGFRLPADATTSNFRVTFTDNGRYTVKVFVKTFADASEICAVEKTVFVASDDPAVITGTLGDKVCVAGQTAEFTITTTGNGEAGTMVLGAFEIRKDGELVNIADVATLEYLDASTDNWYEFYGDFGPVETGFPLQADATTSNFRVTFKENGRYTVRVFVKTFEEGIELCTVEKAVFVANAIPAVITSTLGNETYTVEQTAEFTVTTIGNEDTDTMVLGSFEIRKDGELVNIADVATLEYLEVSSGNWYEFYGDFGPAATGFPLQADATTSNFRVTFKEPGQYTVKVYVKTFSHSEELCSVEKSVVVKLNQDDFAFADEKLVITYNDNDDNKYTYEVQNAKGTVTYEIVSGNDIAQIDATTGELTVRAAGEVVVKATDSGNTLYNPAKATYTLTVKKDTQEFADVESFEEAVSLTYGQLTYEKTVSFKDKYHISDANIKYTLSDTEIAEIDDETGVVTFANNKVGTFEVTASVEGDDCYEPNSISYTITVSYLETEAVPTVDTGWHTDASVVVYAPEGYTVSKTGALDGDWDETATFTADDGLVDSANNEVAVYLKEIATGYIADAKMVSDIKVDTTPADLDISYQKDNFLKLIFDKIFLMTNKDITVSFEATDDVSGIKKVEYSLDNGVTFAEVVAENGVYQASLIEEARYQIVLRVTNNADLVSERRIDGDETLTVVYDKSNPEIESAYVGQHKKAGDIYYTNDKNFAVEFIVNDDSYDLMDKDSDDTQKNLPVILVNGEEYENTQWSLYEKDGVAYGKAVLNLAEDYGEGEYDIQVIANDRLNESIYTQTVYVDWTALEIAPVKFDAGEETSVADGRYYYNAAQSATIVINEPYFNAEDVQVTITVDGNEVDVADYIETDWESNDSKTVHTLVLKFSEDANYSLDVAYTDIPGNTAPDYKEDLFAVDTKAPTGLKIVYKSDLLGNVWPDFLEGLFGFAKNEMTVTISAEDATAGIKQLTYDYGNGETTVATDGSYTFKIPAEHIGQVTFTATDYSGWTTTVDNEGKTVIVDSINPQMTVTYSTENRQDQVLNVDAGTARYRQSMETTTADTRFVYNGEFSATVSIEETNFWDSQVQISVTRDGDPYNGYEQTDWTDATRDNKLYRDKVLTFKDDGDYVITVTYVDESTNEMEWNTDEFETNEGTRTYVSNIHTIDTVAPEVTVSYANEDTDVANTNYHSANRTATVTVKDRNFRPNEFDFQVEATNINGDLFDYEGLKLYQWVNGTSAVWVKTAEADTWETNVEIPFAVDANYEVAVAYQDIATNEAQINDFEKIFTVDKEAPIDLKVTYSKTVQDTILEAITFGYWEASRMVTLEATDRTAGVEYFTVTATAEGPGAATNIELPQDLKIYVADKKFEGTNGFLTADAVEVTEENGTVSMSFEVPAQFRGKISFTATDMGHLSSDGAVTDKTLVVDTFAPGCTVSYNPSNVVNVSDMKDKADFNAANGLTDITSKDASYVMYFTGDAVANIKITEANFDPSKVSIAVQNAAGVEIPEGTVWTQGQWTTTTAEAGGDQVHTNAVTIYPEGDYQIKVYYQDYSQNTPVDYLSQRIAIDENDPKIKVAYKDIVEKNENKKDINVRTATVTIEERNFRPDDVVIDVTAKNVLGDNVLKTIGNTDVVESYRNEGTTKWIKTDENTYVLELRYAADANYTFDIKYQDLAKRAAVYTEEKLLDYPQDLFTIDNTNPEDLQITYSEPTFAQKVLESITFGYYQSQMEVTISAVDKTAGVDYFEYSYLLADNVSTVNAQEKNIVVKPSVVEGNCYTATFTIPMKELTATTQFNGSVNFTAYDRSGNSAMKDDVETVRVIVDDINPKATISYNTPVQTANGISYYDGNINATIAIDEANFDAADVKVTVTKDGENYPVNVSWRDNSVDSHIGNFTLTQEGDYIVSVQYTDKSQNPMQEYKSNQLTLDTTMPVVEVSNIKANSANKDEKYGFVITVNDTNLDASTLMPVLKAVVQKEDGVYASKDIDLGEPVAVVDGQSYTYTVEDLPEDGLYTLTCTVQDMSANTMSQVVLDDGESYEQVQFSINRNGSAFGYGDQFSEDLVNQYFIYSVDEDVVIVEVNVDPIEAYKVTLNGEELVEGSDYTTEQTSNAGEWSKRTYTIKKELFASEGEYSIIVSSVDKTETTAFSDVKNLTLAFVVDQTKPVLTITGMEAGGRYQTDVQTVTLIPSDEGGRLNSLKVVVLDARGEPLKNEADADISVRFELSGEELIKYLEDNDGKVTFTIPEGLNNQVKIICNDCAVDAEGLTNEYNELFTRVTVSQNQFVIFYADTSLFVGTIVGILAIIALIIFLIKRKKAKKTATKA